jgi:hypothetical protein
VNVACPYCRKVIALKSVKPGRFAPKCPGCAKVFVLTVPADPAKKPTVAPREPAPAPAAPAAAPVPAAALEQTAPALSGVAPASPPAAAMPALDQTAPLVTPAPDQTSAAAPAPALGQTAALAPQALDQTAAAAPAAPDVTDAWTPGHPASAVDQTEAFSPSAAAGKLDTTEAIPPGARTGSGARDATRVGEGSGDDVVPPALGGYTIVKLLGKGGMGAVYLARQVSLDRNVALKVMNARAASDPTFIARFTREAYAAAQLVHHNIVQIYDIGEEQGMPFFSMEFVRGENLAQVTGQQGKLDPEEAVGYVLQAARGLKFAHDQGMVHRDIKPDNLMLNDQGIVKVADLGLVKTAGLTAAEDQPGGDRPPSLTGLSSVPDVTTVGAAMGTPLYMAPEQGRNAAAVDQRADIYSLGCTLYVMLTGRPPFTGKTPLEVMTKHLTEPVIPPEAIVKRVPKELSAILLKMLAKKPEDRYADLAAVIADLEKFLGVSSAGAFTPKEEHAAALESAVKQFNEAPAARQRAVAVPAFFGVLALLVFLCAVFGLPLWATGVIGLGLMTVLGTFLTSGIIYRTHLFLKARETALESSWAERLRWSAYVLLVLVMLGLFGLLPILIGLALVAAGVCAMYHILIERQLVTERAKALAKAEKLLKTLRLRGLEEEALRQFVAKYSGDRWEELYEALFGYELMIQTRQRLAATEGGKRRSRHAAWRDPIIQWMEARQRAAREKRERKHLQKVEQKRLEAEGLDKTEAAKRAAAAADVMVEVAAGMKQVGDATEPIIEGAPAAPPKPLFNAKKMMEAAERAEREHTERVRPKGPGLLHTLYAVTIGPQPRFLVALVLILGCALWVYQNDGLQNVVKGMWRSALDSGTVDAAKLAAADTKPLDLPGLPEWASRLFSSFNPAVAGVLLIFSAIWRSPRTTLFFFAAVAVLLVGPQLGVPGFDIASLGRVKPEAICLGAGLALAVIGMAVDRLLGSDEPEPRR